MDPADEFHSPYVYGPNDPINGTDFGGMFWEELWNSICGRGWNTNADASYNEMARSFTGLIDPVTVTGVYNDSPKFDYKGHFERTGIAFEGASSALAARYAILCQDVDVLFGKLNFMMGKLNGKDVWYSINGANQYKYGVKKVAESVKPLFKLAKGVTTVSTIASGYMMVNDPSLQNRFIRH